MNRGRMAHAGACREVGELLTPYVHGEASASERAFVQTHLARCAKCRHKLARLSDLHARLNVSLHARASDVQPPDSAWDRLQAQLSAQPPTPPGGLRRRRSSRLRAALEAAARLFHAPLGGMFGLANRGLAVSMLLAGMVMALSAVLIPMFNNQFSATAIPEMMLDQQHENAVSSSGAAQRGWFAPVPDPESVYPTGVSRTIAWWDMSGVATPINRIGSGRWIPE